MRKGSSEREFVTAYHLTIVTILFWGMAVVLFCVLLVTVALLNSFYDFRLWPVIRCARREITEIVRLRVPDAQVSSSQGPTAKNPGNLSFLIKTNTDAERDQIRQDPGIHKQFLDALARAGYPTDTIPVVHFSIESHETVDRDFGGSWSQATHGPY